MGRGMVVADVDCPSARAVRALRADAGLTQKALADRAGVDRIEIIGLEKGRNKGKSARMRDALARAFGLTHEDMTATLTGELAIAEAIRRAHRHQKQAAA